jgi:protein SCO1/2
VRGFLVFLFCLTAACTRPGSNLPDYGKVPDFTMTDSTGQPFSRSAIAGKVWVVDFIYTNCPAECPLMSSKMHVVAKKLQGDNDVQLISISVDPERDTPPVLNEFAKRYGAPTPQWTFLTGSPETVHTLAYNTFHVGDVLGKIEHSTKFVLVDKHGTIRGYYSSTDEEGDRYGIGAMLKDISVLRRG